MNASCVRNITHIPEEILIEVILYLNMKERLSLADTCKKFRTLVLEDKKLLRDLDFSNEAYLTPAADVYKYFNNRNRSEHILKVNLRNVRFSKPRYMFFTNINNAINLVDINIQGMIIDNRWPLPEILRPFSHLKRLSFDWPESPLYVHCTFVPVIPRFDARLQESFSRLVYLSVRLVTMYYVKDLYDALQFCPELEELHVTVISTASSSILTTTRTQLTNLNIVEYCGPEVWTVAEYFVSTLSHPEAWTYFRQFDPLTSMDGFYLEKDVEVCQELLETKLLERVSSNHYPEFITKLGRFVISESILEEVVKIRLGSSPDKFCCFSPIIYEIEGRILLPPVFYIMKLWMLKVEEAKRLLKDPGYEISYLNILHDIEEECDAHMVTSAFPSLTELVLVNVTISERKTPDKTMHSDRQPKSSATPDKPNQTTNPDSCFSKLVESMPNVKHLSVISRACFSESGQTWDLTALHLIGRWRNLTTLRLWHVPIVDGQFLIEIGKQCRNLEFLELCDLGPSHACCYTTELLRMLFHCRSLRDFTLRQNKIGHLFDLFLLLANNRELERISVQSNHEEETTSDLKQPIEQLIHHCSKLNKFVCSMGMSQLDSNELTCILSRLMSELKRKIFLDIS